MKTDALHADQATRRKMKGAVAFGAAAIAFQLLVSGDTAFLALYAAIVTAMVVKFRQIRRLRPPAPYLWYFAIAGLALVAVGNLALDAVTPHLETTPSWFLVPGLVWAVSYLFFAATAFGIVARQWGRRPDRALVIDALIVLVAIMVPVYELVVKQALALDGPLAIRSMNATYLAIDGLLVVLISQLILTGGRRNPSLWFLTTAVGALVVGDFASLVVWSSVDPRYLSAGWIFCYVCLMLTVLHPQLPRLTQRIGDRQIRLDRVRAAILGVALMTVPMTVVVGRLRGGALNSVLLLVAAAVVAVLVLVRLRSLFTERERAQDAVEARERYFRALVQNIGDVILTMDAHARLLYRSPSSDRLFGWDPDDRQADGLAFAHPEDRHIAVGLLRRASDRPGEIVTGQFRAVHKDGFHRWVEVAVIDLLVDRDIGAVVVTCHDVTERHLLEEELRREAYHDALTGLPNRALALDRLERFVRRSQRSGSHIGVAFIDVDDFKQVNDTLGHSAGDELLRVVGERLTDAVRPQDVVARLGGDEFLVLAEMSDDPAFDELGERLVAAFADPVVLAGADVYVTVSVGVAFGTAPESGDDLLRNADVALYRAKETGKNAFALYRPDMQDEDAERAVLVADLRAALRNGEELRVFFQPIIDLATGEPCSVEALVRWEHPSRGLLLPQSFIALAEETGLIVPLGRWVLHEACREMASLAPSNLDLSVNLSVRQLEDDDLVGTVAEALAHTGLSPERLTLEITESSLVADGAVRARLDAVKALGVRLAVDDFGTGYSSLAYLGRLPIDTLKVDREFIASISTDDRAAALIRSILDLAHTAGLRTVAEGVEKQDQAAVLRAAGCEFAQGFLFAHPAPLADVLASLPSASVAAV